MALLNALIPALIAVIGSIAGNIIVQNKTTAVMQQKIDDMKDDLRVLSNRVDSHNNFGLKLERLETKIEAIEKEMKK
nr:MAG TPA: Ion transport protein-gated Calcium channel block, MEMBRANE [Caudoviricetes sp.]